MSKNYAVIENETIVNVIVADSKKIAEQVTGLECIECDGFIGIGWTLVNEVWTPPIIPVIENEALA